MGSNRRSRSLIKHSSSKRRRRRRSESTSTTTTYSSYSSSSVDRRRNSRRKHRRVRRYRTRSRSPYRTNRDGSGRSRQPRSRDRRDIRDQSRIRMRKRSSSPGTPPLNKELSALTNISTVPSHKSTPNVPSSPRPRTNTPIQSTLSSSSHVEPSTNSELRFLPSTSNASAPAHVWPHSLLANFNVVPEFDPTDDNQSVEWWIHKVSECAKIYSWDDKQTCHYALPKLAGLAKKWYQGLPSLLFTWEEWICKLKSAFPSNENYGDLLTKMLKIRCKFGQSFDTYYYDKLSLLNKCEIYGIKAVGCLIHGIDDKFVRMGASACMFAEPEKLLSYLRTISQNEIQSKSRPPQFNVTRPSRLSNFQDQSSKSGSDQIRCFNCGESGHISVKCSKPIKKCTFCHRLGHLTKDCRKRPATVVSSSMGDRNEATEESEPSNKVLCITHAKDEPNAKYYKNVKINNEPRKAYVDLGSTCTLIRETDAKEILHDWTQPLNMPNLRGFGNSIVQALGTKRTTIEVDGVEAMVDIVVVSDQYMHVPVIIGQTFTEKPNIIIHKSSDQLLFFNAPHVDCCDDMTKFKIFVDKDTIIQPNCTSPVTVNVGSKYEGSLFISGGNRILDNQELIVIPGLYAFNNGTGYIMASNITKTRITIKRNWVIARGHFYKEVDDLYVGITNFCEHLEPLPLEQVKLGVALNDLELASFHNLLTKYRDCFALNLAELGKTTLTKMHITLTDETPVVYNPYRMSYKEREQLSSIVEDLLSHGIISESTSSYASPVILVNKKNGEKRLCIDYRALNRKTLKDKYPLPRIEDQLDSLGGNSFFSSLDLASGYYQVPMDDSSKHITAFVTPDGLYEYNRMPFGLANAPSVFQRTINTMLRGSGKRLALAYMDDLLVASKTIKEGMEKLEQVFQLLRNAKLTLKLQKCYFFQTQVDYLGYEISAKGIRPGNLKIEAVKNFPEPSNVHEVRQFVGLASYFRRFVKDFSIIARPLTSLTKKDVPWVFGDEQKVAFNTLKERLVSRPLLALYDPAASIEVHTDASKLGIGAILLQKIEDKLQPVAYYSRQTSPEEQKFHSYELETLALVTALQKFRVYLLGTTFKAVTDCNAIRNTMNKRDLVPRVARWWIMMQEYNFSIEYRPGFRMAHVDALSRNPANNDDREIPDILDVFTIDNDTAWLETVQSADPELQRMMQILQDPESNNVVEIKNNFTIKNGKLYRVDKHNDDVALLWVVPKSVRWQILQMNHDNNGHVGFEKTYDRIKKVYWFKGMRKFIKKYCKACLQCAHTKVPSGPKEGMLHPIEKVSKPFDTLHADHCGPFPISKKKNQYVLAIIDSFTKYIYLKAVKDCRSKTTIQVFEDYFALFGVPRRLITDRGTSFTSHEFNNFVLEKGMKHVLNAVATPRANGQIERYNRTFVNLLSAANYGKPENEWDISISKIQWSLNNTLNKGTGKTPAETLFGVAPTGSCDSHMNALVADAHQPQNLDDIRNEVEDHIAGEQSKQKTRFDRTRKDASVYKVGDLVRVERDMHTAPGQSRKLVPKCSGPYRVTRVFDNDRYEVQDTPITRKEGRPKYTGVYPVDKIHPWLVFSNDPISSDSE